LHIIIFNINIPFYSHISYIYTTYTLYSLISVVAVSNMHIPTNIIESTVVIKMKYSLLLFSIVTVSQDLFWT